MNTVRFLVLRLALATAFLATAGSAQALQLDMPNGGTSWVEVSSNGCDGGISGAPADCAANAHTLPLANYILPPNNSAPNPGVIDAQGSVQASHIALSVSTSGSTDGFAFLWGATGGNFTVHGAGVTPLSVTAILAISGALNPTGALSFTSASWRIGTWNSGPVTSELNQRVIATGGTADGISCSFNATCTASSTPFADQLTKTLMVLPETAFNLGFFTLVTGFGAGVGTVGAASIVGDISFLVSEGYYITGDNGFDSRATSAPIAEPATLALLLAGLVGIGTCLRRQKAG